MKHLILAAILFAAPAYAADAPPQIKPMDTFSVTLNAAEWNAVLASVRDSAAVSARDGNALAQSIQQQIMAKAQAPKK